MPTITQAVVDEFKRLIEWDETRKELVYREDRWTGGFAARMIKKKGEAFNSKEYHCMWIFGSRYPIHRLAYCVYNNVIINDKDIIDHRDTNKRNNSPDNLRLATVTENNINAIKRKGRSSKYKGVSWQKAYKKWVVQIKVNKKGIFLGRFDTEEEAARVYNEAALKYHKEFANLNVIEELSSSASQT